jgi:DNA-binding CsgD family transcriptional regulator
LAVVLWSALLTRENQETQWRLQPQKQKLQAQLMSFAWHSTRSGSVELVYEWSIKGGISGWHDSITSRFQGFQYHHILQSMVTRVWERLNTVWLMPSVAMERVLDSFYERVRSPSSSVEAAADADFMKMLCDIYELKHAAYITVDKRSIASRKPKFLVTYPLEWQDEYRRSFAETKDPVIEAGLTEMLPFDWRVLRQRRPQADGLFGLAREFGVGRQGLTIPIRGDDGIRALFTVTSDFNDKDWDDFNSKYRKDFIILANYFHNKVYGESQDTEYILTDREKEVLYLCSLGRTALEISNQLDISVTTVKYFLNQTRHKLETLNTTQTVAKAIKLGLIA